MRPVKTPITLGIQVGLVLIKDKKKKKLSTNTLFNVDARRKNNVQNRHNLTFCNSHPENAHLTLTFRTCANVCSILCALQENISSGSFDQSLLKATYTSYNLDKLNEARVDILPSGQQEKKWR